MPSVAISSVMPSWLTSLRSTSRSMSQASASMTTTAPANASTLTSHFDVEAGRLADPFGEARHRERREQHHRALREIEHAGGLEDQHEAERDQRIQHAGHQAAEQGFEEEAPCMRPQCVVPR